MTNEKHSRGAAEDVFSMTLRRADR